MRMRSSTEDQISKLPLDVTKIGNAGWNSNAWVTIFNSPLFLIQEETLKWSLLAPGL